jgi:transcriptional regulator PpsR
VQQFKAPKEHLGVLSAEAVGALITAAGDIAVILDAKGVIRDVAFQSDELSRELSAQKHWLGKKWSKVVTIESRPKVEAMLREATADVGAAPRQVNHTTSSGRDVPILYSVIKAGHPGSVVALGRDLRPMANLQQQLVHAQESLERDYSRLRNVQMRYHLLFELSAESILIVDSSSMKVIETNPAARKLFGESVRRLTGRSVLDVFTEESVQSVQSLLDGVRAAGRPDNVQAQLARLDRDVLVSASLFRQDGAALFLVRLSTKTSNGESTFPKLKSKMLKIVENAPDGFVVTGPEGLILAANLAFLDMANLATEEHAVGQPLGRWLGRPGVDVDVLIANLKQRGSVRLFGSTMNVEYGPKSDVEVSAVSVMNGGKPCLGFTIRNVAQRFSGEARAARQLPRSPEQLAELIGRMSLKDLVRETTDVIERLCIEAALELTSDNRASAAELLGLSRQSLYVKLRRYGLADDTSDNE